MGIRYYAYAFDAHAANAAMADPRALIGADPFADAWGLEPGARVSAMTGIPRLPANRLLYLDKAWQQLQAMTLSCHPDNPSHSGLSGHSSHPGEPPRPAFRMFEGEVTFTEYGWDPWVRTIMPADVGPIAEDLTALEREATANATDDYVLGYLRDAVAFTALVGSVGGGFAYLIG
jgi:hypothetical protein